MDQPLEKKRLTNIEKILEGLSPEKRILLEKKLKEEGSKFGVFPLSYAQQRLWFIEQLQPGNTAYNIPTAIRLLGNLNFGALQKSLLQIISRHEVLRTYISTIDETPMQIVEKQLSLDINKIDLSSYQKSFQEKEIKKILEEQINEPFNLSKLPLFRITLINLCNDEHILILVMHHIISDGWSAGVFISELSQLYLANSKGENLNLPPLEIQYTDFAKWQKKWLEGDVKEKQLSYWKEKLKNISVLELPTDFKRPKQQTLKGGVVKGEIEKEITESFKKVSQKNGTTLFMSLLAAYNILLYKYSSQDDFAVGTPIANRNKKQIESLIGFFVNTLALRANIEPEISFLEYLTKFKDTILSAFTNQDLPFEMIIEELQPERDMSHTPIFQVMFAFQNKSDAELKLGDIQLSQMEFDSTMSKFDITFIVAEKRNGNLLLTFEYNKDLFTSSTIERMIEHYKKIISEIINNEKIKINEIPIITEKEKEQVFNEFNVQGKKYKVEKTLHQIFEERVKEQPNAIAVKLEDKEYTYSALNNKANKIASILLNEKTSEEKLIGIYMDRSIEMIVGILGVLKAGYGYLPMDPVYPNDRLSFMIEDAKVKRVITQEQLKENLPEEKVNVILIEKKILEEEKIYDNVNITISPNELAYCIYTSGSTGKPKGTLISHKNVVRLFYATDKWFGFNNDDIWTLFHSFAFDFSVWEIFGALLYGGKLVIVPYMQSRNPAEFYELLIRERITVLNQTPSAFRQLLQIDEESKSRELNLKYIIFGGEALDLNILSSWIKNHGDEKPELINMYGITETTVHVTYRRIRKKDVEENKGSIIGKAIDDLQVYILDEKRNILPVGISGEIYVGGDGLAEGYLNRDNLTREKFIKNNFTKVEGERLYKSGDLAKYLKNGDLEYLGRKDNQVKIRGFRIELGEIKSLLTQNENIKEAEIILYDKKIKDKVIAAYLVPVENIKIDIEEIRNYLTQFIPEYMIPSAFVLLDQFPLTPNGKIDIKALPEPISNNEASRKEIIEAQTESEMVLTEIIRDLLQINRISITDNFFLIGGHSLLATQLLIRIKKKLSIDIPLKYIFEKPVIKDFAKIVDKYLNKEKKSKTVQIPKVSRDNFLHLSYQQQRLWFLDQLDPMNSSYNIPVSIKIKGKLNLDFVNEAVNTILTRHEILRSYIETIEGQPLIKIVEIDDYKIEILDLTNKDREQVYSLSQKIFSEPFSLKEYPLFRIKILKTNTDEYLLLFVIHHIISDGWSGGIFINEFATIYSGLIQNVKIDLPKLDIQYVDFANWQREYLSKTVFEDQLKYWESKLSNVPSLLELPLDKPRPAVQTFNGRTKRFRLSEDLSRRINELSKTKNVTPFMILIAAFNVLLSKYSHQNDICIGTPVANRNHQTIENLIGFFVNTLVIRTNLSNNPSISGLLDSVKETSLEAFSNQDVPFEKIVDSLDIERSVSHTPVFQVMFTFQNLLQNKIELPYLELETVEPDSNISKFDMSLTMTEAENSILVGTWEYNTDIFYDSTIDRMLEHFQIILDEFVSNTSQKINEIQIISENEKYLLLDKWNNTDYNYPQSLLHKMFEKEVNNNPNKIAVEYEGKTITYNLLNKKSNKLANYLMQNNVALETIVGIYMQPSIETIVAILAVLKSGGAYLPLDPKYPESRIKYMIEDSNVQIILTEEKFEQNLAGLESITYSIDKDENRIFEENDILINIKQHPTNLAYVIYTSGSTGKPKGVACTHDGVVNHIYDFVKREAIIDDVKGSLWTSLNFDVSIYEIFHTLSHGGELHIIPDEIRSNGEELFSWLSEHKITNAYLPPFLLEDFGEWLETTSNDSSLKTLLVGVEPIKLKVLSKIKEKIPGILIVNGYGPTETTINSTAYEFIETTESNEITPIGKPIINTKIYLLDKYFNPVPIGIPGELYIATKAMSRGYVNNSATTAERFLPNPFSKLHGERLYKTGDLAKYTLDGNIKFVGRSDFQVKLRGFRVELGEIESLLNSHKDINQSVVIIREDKPNVKKLVAYFTSDNPDLQNEDLEQYLSKSLPDYMMPNFFVRMDKIPLTPNSKIDRKSLPEPKVTDTISTEEYVEPQTEKEIILAGVWQEILGFEKIGSNDNFFKLGGDSIVAIQMIAKAKQKGLQITPVQIFQNQILQKLALVAKEVEIVSAEQGIVNGIAPLTPIQKYFFENNFSEPNHWNQSIFLKITETLSEEKLKDAVKLLLLHHDELRVKFEYVNNKWQQNILEAIEEIPFEVVDLTNTSSVQIKEKIENINFKVQASLDITSGNVIKVVYYKINENESRILIVVHHLVIDGVSWRILIEDLITSYNLLTANKEVILPAKTTSFKEWSEFINNYVTSEKIIEEKSFWLTLSEKQFPEIEKDFNSNDNLEDSLFSESLVIDAEETNYLLKSIHETYNTQINDILLSALFIAYNKWKGKRQLLVHMEGHGREELSHKYDVSRTIGWFTALFPISLDMADAIEIGDIIKLVKENLRSIPNKGIGFGILRYLSPDTELQSKLKIFDDVQLMFNYLGQFDQTVPENTPFTIAEENKGVERGIKNKRISLIDVTAAVSQGVMSINISASKNQFKQESLKLFLENIKEALQNIINNCKGNDKVEYTSSDFDLIDLEDDQLSSVLNKLNNEDD
jgi:amino acid adenylation domain-containing protein/non-ribosomal peptide synthase protein (TIGR01720 family)